MPTFSEMAPAEIKVAHFNPQRRTDRYKSALAALSESGEWEPVEVQPPQHVREYVAMEMGLSMDELRFVLYNDADKSEWLNVAQAVVSVPIDVREAIVDALVQRKHDLSAACGAGEDGRAKFHALVARYDKVFEWLWAQQE